MPAKQAPRVPPPYEPVKYVNMGRGTDKSPKSEPAQELHSRAVPSVEAHHCVNGPNTKRNSGGRQIIKKALASLKKRARLPNN